MGFGAGAAGVEHETHGDVELAHSVLGPLEVAAHPIEAVGNARKHLGTLPKRVIRLLFQNPCVLAAAALRGVDDERAFFEGDARESSGDDVDLVAKENVRPQIDVARLKTVADEAGSAGEIERGLRDVVARIGLDAARRTPRAGGRWSAGR